MVIIIVLIYSLILFKLFYYYLTDIILLPICTPIGNNIYLMQYKRFNTTICIIMYYNS